MKKMMKEFKAFAIKGNVIDMAIGIVIGGAFGKIVSSFVADIIMPIVGVLIGGINFSDLAITIKKATETADAVTINYGTFIDTIVTFLIIAFSIFIVIKQMNRFKKEEEEKEKKPSEDIILLQEIRDELRKR